ncbi:MAG: GNAT family N-acetyltransferase [Rhodospirillaceae bacterium]
MDIRPATDADRDAIWAILEPVIREGETYSLPRTWTREQALAYWFAPERTQFVAEEAGRVLGIYFIRANREGGGAHVANCGYMTAPAARGRGVAQAMCAHSLAMARERGFRAMQFNFVVSTNERAVAAWKRMGFDVVGTLPGAFDHPRLGYVDAFVMYQRL